MFENLTFGFCIWDILALIVLAAIIITFAVHQYNYRKRRKKWKDSRVYVSDDR